MAVIERPGPQPYVLVLASDMSEHKHFLYGFRLLAYLLILAAIVDKNRPRRQG